MKIIIEPSSESEDDIKTCKEIMKIFYGEYQKCNNRTIVSLEKLEELEDQCRQVSADLSALRLNVFNMIKYIMDSPEVNGEKILLAMAQYALDDIDQLSEKINDMMRKYIDISISEKQEEE